MNATPPRPPAGWGDDTLSQFIDTTRQNAFASFANLGPQYRRIADVDAAFKMIVENLKNPGDWFVPLFLLRAHSSFLGGAHLGLAGQLPEAYMLLRGSIENAVYAFYFHLTPDSHERWMRRHDDESSKKKVQEEFRIRALLRLVRVHDANLGKVADALYERTIDFGGHPNERALTQVLKLSQDGSDRHFHVNYLSGRTAGMELCLRTIAQIGVFVLKVFERVYPERFALLGISDRIEQLQRGL